MSRTACLLQTVGTRGLYGVMAGVAVWAWGRWVA